MRDNIMAETKEKLLRVLQIMKKTDKYSPLNAQQIVNILKKEYNIDNVNRKSIYNDILLMETCGYGIVQCKDKKKGWYLDNREFEDWEIKIMLDSVVQAKCITDEDTKGLVKKLLNITSQRGRYRLTQMMFSDSVNKSRNSKANQYIELMMEAIYTRKKIEFQYTELDFNMNRIKRKGGKIYNLNLYTLYWSNDNYYLIGIDDKHKTLSNYRLDRIDNLRISGEDAVASSIYLGSNAELVIKEYIETRVDNYGGENINLILEFEPDSVKMGILYDFAGDKVRITHMDNGNIRVRIRKQNSVALINWLMKYSVMFKVVAPEHVKTEVVERLHKAMEMYND